jgi:uncharacterized protein
MLDFARTLHILAEETFSGDKKMLIEFTVGNFLSFKEPVTLSMVASSDKSLPENVIRNAQGTKFDLLKSAAIFGPNAAGKSNFIKATTILYGFVNEYFSIIKPGMMLPMTPFGLDKKYSTQPSLFEIVFLSEGIRYQYGFKADAVRVHDEWLFSFPKNQSRKVFHRIFNKENENYEYQYGTGWKAKARIAKEIEESTPSNASFLSMSARFNVDIAQRVTRWFLEKWRRLISSDREGNKSEYRSIVEFMQKEELLNKEGLLKEEILALFNELNIDIDNLEIESRSLSEMPDYMKARFKNSSDYDEKNDALTIVKAQRTGVDEKGNPIDVFFPLQVESDGTQKLFLIGGTLAGVLTKGRILWTDELHASLHPYLTRRIIEYFHETRKNVSDAQLIFTTHDSSLLDTDSLFRRDQIWFVEKDKSGASELFSLWDIKRSPRKTENIRKRYLEGRYGAVPILGHL